VLVSGFLSELEHDVLSEWFNHLVASADVHVDLFGKYSLYNEIYLSQTVINEIYFLSHIACSSSLVY